LVTGSKHSVIERSGGLAAAWLVTASLVLYAAGPAWAIQSHPEPEGLFVHQLAHLLFIVSMAFLAYWLETNRFTERRGWRYIQTSALLFALWNAVAVCGHYVEERVPRALFAGDPDLSQRLITGTSAWTTPFYALKLDHLVCVPAIVCLFVGIRTLYWEVVGEGDSDRE
jgi:hypothetical protein